MNNNLQFMQYCKILGIDSNTIRNKIVKNVAMTITKHKRMYMLDYKFKEKDILS